MNRSPLGKYAQIVAAVVAVGVILIWGVSELAYSAGFLTHAPDSLRTAALLALGAVFGSAAAINGVKEPIDAAHARIDHLETGTGIQTHGAYPTPWVESVRGGDAHDSDPTDRRDLTLPPDPPPVT